MQFMCSCVKWFCSLVLGFDGIFLSYRVASWGRASPSEHCKSTGGALEYSSPGVPAAPAISAAQAPPSQPWKAIPLWLTPPDTSECTLPSPGQHTHTAGGTHGAQLRLGLLISAPSHRTSQNKQPGLKLVPALQNTQHSLPQRASITYLV